jgi:hypothetical protein
MQAAILCCYNSLSCFVCVCVTIQNSYSEHSLIEDIFTVLTTAGVPTLLDLQLYT